MSTNSIAAAIVAFVLSFATSVAFAQTTPAADVMVPGWRHIGTMPKNGFTLHEYRGEGNNSLRYAVRTVPKGTFESWRRNEYENFLKWYTGKLPYTIEGEQPFSQGAVQGTHLKLLINGHRRNASLGFWVGKDGGWRVLVAFNQSEERPIVQATLEAIKAFSR